MKKVHLLLAIIAITATVGGAYAFKANRNINVFYRMNAARNACNITVMYSYTTTAIGGFILTDHWSFSGPTTSCQVRVTASL